MNSDYLIIDPRPLEAFKDKTFSDFKKRDVYNTLFKCIDEGILEEACYLNQKLIFLLKLLIFVTQNLNLQNMMSQLKK